MILLQYCVNQSRAKMYVAARTATSEMDVTEEEKHFFLYYHSPIKHLRVKLFTSSESVAAILKNPSNNSSEPEYGISERQFSWSTLVCYQLQTCTQG